MTATEHDPLPLNEAGTHVATITPTGDSWDCPLPYLPIALGRGFTVAGGATPPVPSGLFDPADHNVEEVDDYLLEHAEDDAEIDRVLALEAAGKARTTIVDPRPAE